MKAKGNEWFKTWFNTPEYLELYKHRDKRDASKVVRLLFKNIKIPKGAKVLDLACGNGRHSLQFAKKGFDTLGIDLSPFLIKEAKKQKAGVSSGELRFEIKDMRKIGHPDEFQLVVNLFSSFGYFEKDSENEKVIQSVSRSLTKGGYFFFDFLNSYHLERNLVPFGFEKRKDGAVILLRYIKNNLCYKDILIFSDKDKSKFGFRRYSEKVRMFTLVDFKKMFERNSLKIKKVFGDYKGGVFNKSKSERLILIAEKV